MKASKIAIELSPLFKKKIFLGMFAKLRKATISFVMPVCLYGMTRLPVD
jgi:hypothetical protein